MLMPNMNWLGVLCKKLAGVKDGVIVKKSKFLGATHHGDGEVWGDCVKIL